MIRGSTSCEAASRVLGDARSSLRSSIERVAGTKPQLVVMSSVRVRAPAWASPPLAANIDVLIRRTGYRVGSVDVSRHIAVLQISAFGPERIGALEGGEASLAELLRAPHVRKADFRVELLDDDAAGRGTMVGVAAQGVAGPLATRRYHVTIDGAPAGIVVEALPCATWDRLVRSRPTTPAGNA